MLKMVSSISAIPLKVQELKSTANDFIDNNKTALAIGGAGAAGIVVGGIVGAVAAKRSSIKKKSTKRAKASSARKRSSSSKKRKSRTSKYARTAGKGKDRSTKRIRMTKNGQPYVIMASGKARFIKKSSARLARKRKGGRY